MLSIKRPSDLRLDILTFSVSGLRDGLGPLLGVFLIQRTHLDAMQVSSVLAAAGVINLLLQIPIGFLYDSGVDAYVMVGVGGLCLGVSCYLVSLVPPYSVALASQIAVGIGGCLLSVGLPALTIKNTKIEFVHARLARNEIFSKVGNFCSIGLMGFLSQAFNLQWMFYVPYLAAAMLVGTCISGLKNRGARDRPQTSDSKIVAPSGSHFFKDIICNPKLFPILLSGFFYQFANASMFMIFEQQFVRKQINGGVGVISSSLLITQVMIILSCVALNRTSRALSLGIFLQIGFVIIVLRGLILLANTNFSALYAAQILDGVIAAILIVVPVSTIARFAGHNFNRMSATFGMVIVGAASLSTLCSGYMISHTNFTWAYLTLICTAVLGVVVTRILNNRNCFRI